MLFRLFLTTLLFCTPAIYSMELNIFNINDEIFTTAICPHLNRPNRDALRLTCTKYFKIVSSQDELNKNYTDAYKKNDGTATAHWKSMGGLLPHQEFANAIKNNHDALATWLIKKDHISEYNAYHTTITEAVKLSKIQDIVSVITWLLCNRKPRTNYYLPFISIYHYINTLNNIYPEIKTIVDLFDEYENKEND